ncbi:MAG: hypothetical protein ACK2TW_06650 [Anaerolineales bacterium]
MNNNGQVITRHPSSSLFVSSRFNRIPWLPEALAILGGIVFLAQLWRYAHLLDSLIDEGLYLYKGLLFVSGQYSLYQFYGPWTSKMPLSYLIPGLVQFLFGPDLGVGRTFSGFLAGLFLLGFWILARRLGGRWWAALLIWILAANIALIKMYSIAVSQVLIACMLVWVLVLLIGDDRPAWQIVLGSLLAGLLAITRFNMLLLLPALFLYLIFQYGTKKGAIACLICTSTIILGHALFWPGILQVWALQLPRSMTPFLDLWRTPEPIPNAWAPDTTTENRLISLSQTYRNHFVSLATVMGASFFGLRKKDWKKESDYRTFLFLFVLYILMLAAHVWAALGEGYCIYCLTGYLGFFSFIGLLILPLSYPLWRIRIPVWFQIVILLFIVSSAVWIGFGSYEQIGGELLDLQLPRSVLYLSPDSSGSMPLFNYFKKTHGYDFKTSRRIISSISGLMIAALIFVLAALIKWIRSNRSRLGSESHTGNFPVFGFWALTVFIIAGALITPAIDLLQECNTYFCERDIIHSYRSVGSHISKLVPPGSKVYWKGGNSAVPLLYLPGIQIYPAQLNGDYTYKKYGNPKVLDKYGYWSEELSEKWLNEADYILVQQRFFNDWYQDQLNPERFEELESTKPAAYCEENTHIRIFIPRR